MLAFRWTCGCCGQEFDSLPLDIGATYLLDYFAVPEVERASRVRHTKSLCAIDGNSYYVRGCVEVPIIGRDERFAWGVWVSVSAASWNAIHEAWDRPDCANEPPYFGWLNAALKLYPDTINLKTKLYLRPDVAPYIELEPTDHPLAREQREDRVLEIAAAYSQHDKARG
ncbi:MAG TPA: DUF2199 domain-containing protein [Dongiaceae bacterium]|jgi:hypothetical protein